MEIISFKSRYKEDFKNLNLEWLNHFFWVEPHDEEVLGNPEKYIIESGGSIFLALENGRAIATVALMKMDEGVFELTKMAVSPDHRGKNIGQKLMQYTLNFAKSKRWQKLIIYSNRKLENAIHIYKKYGFEEIPIEENNPYARGDIKMKLELE